MRFDCAVIHPNPMTELFKKFLDERGNVMGHRVTFAKPDDVVEVIRRCAMVNVHSISYRHKSFHKIANGLYQVEPSQSCQKESLIFAMTLRTKLAGKKWPRFSPREPGPVMLGQFRTNSKLAARSSQIIESNPRKGRLSRGMEYLIMSTPANV